MKETQARSLGWEDPLGVGNGNSLQYFCLENSMDRGATVHEVTIGYDASDWAWGKFSYLNYTSLSLFSFLQIWWKQQSVLKKLKSIPLGSPLPLAFSPYSGPVIDDRVGSPRTQWALMGSHPRFPFSLMRQEERGLQELMKSLGTVCVGPICIIAITITIAKGRTSSSNCFQ